MIKIFIKIKTIYQYATKTIIRMQKNELIKLNFFHQTQFVFIHTALPISRKYSVSNICYILNNLSHLNLKRNRDLIKSFINICKSTIVEFAILVANNVFLLFQKQMILIFPSESPLAPDVP